MYNLPQVSNELTKNQLKIMSESIIDDIINNGNVIEIAEVFAKVEFLVKEIRANSNFIEHLRDEISKFGKSVETITGTKIELAEVGTKYDFSQCGDADYYDLISERAYLDVKIKERETYLKSLPQNGVDIVNKDGELVTLYRPSKSSTSSVKFTIAK
jgi:hypothetical protein